MIKLTQIIALVMAVFSVGVGAGCAKKNRAAADAVDPALATAATNAAAPEAPQQLAGQSEVMAAVEKKDYDGAMAALLRVRQSITSDQQTMQYTVLSHELKLKLMAAAATDPKAADALTALRSMTVGR